MDSEAPAEILTEESLRPNLALLLCGIAAAALVSIFSLPWPVAIASTTLGALMIAGTDIDTRTYLLPDTITWGSAACGIAAAFVLDPVEPWLGVGAAIIRSAGTSLTLALVRWCYARVTGHEGLGFGDVKLAAGVGAWLPFEAIPLCFGLATVGALTTVISARLCGRVIDRTTKVPFGAFLCPALWLSFFVSALAEIQAA